MYCLLYRSLVHLLMIDLTAGILLSAGLRRGFRGLLAPYGLARGLRMLRFAHYACLIHTTGSSHPWRHRHWLSGDVSGVLCSRVRVVGEITFLLRRRGRHGERILLLLLVGDAFHA